MILKNGVDCFGHLSIFTPITFFMEVSKCIHQGFCCTFSSQYLLLVLRIEKVSLVVQFLLNHLKICKEVHRGSIITFLSIFKRANFFYKNGHLPLYIIFSLVINLHSHVLYLVFIEGMMVLICG